MTRNTSRAIWDVHLMEGRYAKEVVVGIGATLVSNLYSKGLQFPYQLHAHIYYLELRFYYGFLSMRA
jgi:hypothetical protein